MVAAPERWPVLVLAGDADKTGLRQTLTGDALQTWQVLEAHSIAHAQFLLQHDSCAVVLLDQSFSDGKDTERLVSILAAQEVPVVLLTTTESEPVAAATETAAPQRLPRSLVLSHPTLLNEALRAALRARTLQRRLGQATADLHDCRRRAHHLVNLLWETLPAGSEARWLTQRHLMERLHEEIGRAERYQVPFSLAIGEFPVGSCTDDPKPSASAARTWMVDRLIRGKRRSDSAGQYGPHGFLLLLPGTSQRGAGVCCRRLQRLLEQPADVSAERAAAVSTCVPFGIASYSATAASSQSLLARAEQCLTRAQANREVSI
jgi:PleD family two-component response regulator